MTHTAYLKLLVDLTVIDRLHYGLTEWHDSDALIDQGFGRARDANPKYEPTEKNTPRFVLVIHFLSLSTTSAYALKFFYKIRRPKSIP